MRGVPQCLQKFIPAIARPTGGTGARGRIAASPVDPPFCWGLRLLPIASHLATERDIGRVVASPATAAQSLRQPSQIVHSSSECERPTALKSTVFAADADLTVEERRWSAPAGRSRPPARPKIAESHRRKKHAEPRFALFVAMPVEMPDKVRRASRTGREALGRGGSRS